jgi:serine/threonine-protein kinase
VDLTGRTLLGKYQIEGLLGQGGMGAVWRARHALTGRKLAIKTLDEGYLDNPAIVQRFGREARAASACQHPGIVEVLDLDQTEDGLPFLVMEFLEGETLAKRIEKRGRLDEEELVRLGSMLLEALAAAHAQGVIHRDLKPENIYVVPAGRRGEVVKILDFGISHKRDEAGAKLTMTGSVLGTPHYMSPEQAMGETEIDHRADLYAAGVVLYECAVGDVPFDAPNYNKLLRTILDRQPVPPRRRGAQISEAVERLILWAMEKERERRIGSATEMLDWLQRAHAGQAVPYRPPEEPGAARSTPPPAAQPAFTPAGSLPAAGRSGLSSHTLTGDAPTDSWRPSPQPVRPVSTPPVAAAPPSKELDLGFDDGLELDLDRELGRAKSSPPPPGELLEIDEEVLRRRSHAPPSGHTPAAGVVSPPAGGGTRTGSYAAVPTGVADRSGAHVTVDPSEPPPPPPRTWPRYAAIAGLAIAGLAAVLVGLRIAAGPDEEPEPLVELPPPVVEEPREPVRARPSWVSVRVEGLPPEARLRLDGLPASSPVRVLRGGQHVLEISAPGYEDRRIEFTADQNRTLDANLRPAEGIIQLRR